MRRLLALMICLAAPLAAQQGLPDPANAATTRLDEARQAYGAAESASDPIAQLTLAVRLFEDGLIAAQAGAVTTARALADLQDPLSARHEQTSRLLAAAILAQQRSGVAVTASPQTALLVAETTTGLGAAMADIVAAYDALAKAAARHETTARVIATAEADRAAALADLRVALEAASFPQRFEDDPVISALLLAESATLADLLNGLGTIDDLGLPNDSVLAAKGALPQPVTGRVLHGFGTTDDAGASRSGTILATPARALVVSPTQATILFAGPFETLENVVVIAPDATVMVTFAGLDEVFGRPGQIIPAGTPLGLMGGQAPSVDGKLTAPIPLESGGESQALYLGVREGQTPVDPATWFALENEMDKQ